MDALVISQIRRLQRKGRVIVASGNSSVNASVWNTRLNVSGRGHLVAVAVRGATTPQQVQIRITIDGGTATTLLTHMTATDLYMRANGSNGKTAILGVPFSSSLLVEVWNNDGASQSVESQITYILS